jgi:hypothetical protein
VTVWLHVSCTSHRPLRIVAVLKRPLIRNCPLPSPHRLRVLARLVLPSQGASASDSDSSVTPVLWATRNAAPRNVAVWIAAPAFGSAWSSTTPAAASIVEPTGTSRAANSGVDAVLPGKRIATLPETVRATTVRPACGFATGAGSGATVASRGAAGVADGGGGSASGARTLKARVAGEPSVLPAASAARTLNVCSPAVRSSRRTGDRHPAKVPGAAPAESTRHSNRAPASSAVNANVAERSLIVPLGPESIVVSGAMVSIVNARVPGLASMLPAASTALTRNV